MNKLLINKKEFDEKVWQDKTDFTQKDYNDWLHKAIDTLCEIYDGYNGHADVFILGDIINMLGNTEIKLDKTWGLTRKKNDI